LLAYGTLAGGFLTERWLGKTEPANNELTTWSEMKYKRFIDTAGGWEVFQNLLRSLNQIAGKHDVSIANIASRYVLENKHVVAIIVGARLGKSEHIAENVKLLELSLQADDIALIKEAQQQLKPIPGDCGDEYRKPPYLTASGDLSHHLEEIPKAFDAVELRKGKLQIFSGTVWEELAGYCRGVKDGNRVYVAGTTATHGAERIGGNDPAAQTHFIIDKIEAVIESFGGTLADVVRTRVFVNNLSDWEPVARAHGERFKDIQPANTLVEAKLVGDGYLVEIEADAILH
jgi:enamine deaminase RidA (YjgF/YER057c/UK114 family)